MSQQPDQSDNMQKGQQVAQAGAEAAAQAPPEQAQDAARQAMRKERDRTGLEFPDTEIDRIAEALSPKLIEGFRQQGAFDAPPEPIAPPQQTTTAPPPGDGEAAAQAHEPAPAPVKRTFAHRFMGVD